jgi:uncharacterized coiled-coil protein SlyX
MDDRLQVRLSELRIEYSKGEQTLADLETKTANVRATMLRISGAIQVLEELTQAVTDDDGEQEASRGNGQAVVAAVPS